MDSESRSIILTSRICERIKKLYHLGSTWSDSYLEVAKKLSSMKESMKVYYPTLSGEDVLETVFRLDDKDFKEMIDIKKDVLRET